MLPLFKARKRWRKALSECYRHRRIRLNNATVKSINGVTKIQNSSQETQKSDNNFSSILDKTLGELNSLQKKSDEAVKDIATGNVKDLHQAAIAINKAEMSMKLTLEVRNKALNAYKELARTQM
ncbi:MAG: flagellar hook-basal body complex protein FliE [Epsilonproteobacteria bacterium]|nr:flagellar hook-basal body complex protein FliE [Campylobacterota bacterium]